MSAPVHPRIQASKRFNECCNHLAESFRHNGGEITRSRFRQIVAEYAQDLQTMQAYFESAGMRVDPINRIASQKLPGDRFDWSVS